MTPLELAVYGAAQGVTEFLPVSSSAHQFALERLFGWPEAGRTLAVAGHLGTLLAVVLHGRHDLIRLAGAAFRPRDPAARELAGIAVACLPLFAAGLAAALLVPARILSLPEVMAAAGAGGAVLLFLADTGRLRIRMRAPEGPAAWFVVGLVQSLALVPGMSRAGSAITGGRLLGWDRTKSTRAALLLGVPAILGAGAVEGALLWSGGDAVRAAAAGFVALVSWASAQVAIAGLVRWVRHGSFLPFIMYRLAFAGALLLLLPV